MNRIARVLPSTILANIQLFLISLQRLDRTDLLERWDRENFGLYQPYPWEQRLLGLTLGKVGRDSLLPAAKDDRQRCEVHFYAGHRFLTFGDLPRAKAEFARCAGLPVDCAERRLALAQRARLVAGTSPSARHRVAGLRRRLAEQPDPAGALPLARELEALAARTLDGDDPLLQRVLFLVGRSYFAAGQYAAATPVFGTLVHAMRVAGHADLPEFGDVVQTYGHALMHTGKPGEAVRQYEEVLVLREATVGTGHPVHASALHNLGAALMEAGNAELAQPILERALALARRVSPPADVAATLNALSKAYLTVNGNHDRVAELLRESAETAPSVQQKHVALHNLAALKASQDREDEALALLRQLRAERQGTGRDGTEQDIADLNLLARILIRRGEHEEAFHHARAALDASGAVWGAQHRRLAELLVKLLVTSAATGRLEYAADVLARLQELEDVLLRAAIASTSARGRVRVVNDLRENAQTVLTQLTGRLAAVPGAARSASAVLLRGKGLLGRLAEAGLRRPAGTDELRTELDDLAERLHQLEMTGPVGSDGYDDYVREQRRLKDRRDEAELKLARLLDPAAALPGIHPEEVAAAVPADAALVDFARFAVFGEPERNRYLAVVSTRDSAPVLVDLGPAEVIDEAVAAFHDLLTGAAPDRSAPDLIRPATADSDEPLLAHWGGVIRERIFDPVVPHLHARTRVLVAPDGEIATVPFEVLPAAGGGHLVDEYRFQYLNFGGDVLRTAPEAPSGPDVVVASPDYDLGGVSPAAADDLDALRAELREAGTDAFFAPLDGAREEGAHVAALLGVQPLTGPDALKARVKHLTGPRILHLATHGFYWPSPVYDLFETTGMVATIAAEDVLTGRRGGQRLLDPFLRSGLALAGANVWLGFGTPPAEAGNGLLTADDVLRMRLAGTDLVVLSACETGRGQVRNLDGVLGLRQAFTIAGARTLVVSLWKVPDQVTRELFDEFYPRLLAGSDCAEALREARSAIRARHPHPRDWGGFVCQGEPGATRLRTR
ncbi:CHAT domain-containing protein [Amycolatopsis sp. cmx-4-68]|uniref:CHAT domain-containing tetratricopeptide repeat protein n=1 Tax=Amycolatopsis sp. cmx-4-68 TaxID=2790938 RepID=UPI00397D2ED0